MKINFTKKLPGIVWIIFLWIFQSSFCHGQVPKLESADECADWFLANWSGLDRKYACVGEAHVTLSTTEGFLVIEWFEIKFVEPGSQKTYHYVEARRVYTNGEQSDRWEKWMKRDKEYLWCMGNYSSKLQPVNEGAVGASGKPAIGVVREIRTPTVFPYSVVTGSIFNSDEDCKEIVDKVFADSIVLTSERNGEDKFSGFFARNTSGTEIVFDAKSNWMPVLSRGFFRKNREPELTRTSYEVVNFEAKSKWETLGTKYYVPTAVTNFVRHVSPKSKTSRTVDLRVAWAIDGISTEMFSNKSLEEYNENTGPIIVMRDTLRNKLEKTTLPAK